jgi:hypothetical protein
MKKKLRTADVILLAQSHQNYLIKDIDIANGEACHDIDLNFLLDTSKEYKSHKKKFHLKSVTLSKIINVLKNLFLPAGYPNSVPPEYTTFQIWNIIQDFCSFLRGVMSTAAILQGMGVGRTGLS